MQEKYDPPSLEGNRQASWKLLGGAWVLGVCLALAGCGYSLSHRLKEGFRNPNGVYVPVFTNNTDEVGAERVFTDAAIRELQSRGEIRIVEKTEGAYEFRGTVESIRYLHSALTPTPFGGLQNYRRLPTEIVVEVGISCQLVNPKTQEILWGGSFGGFRRVAGVLSRTQDFQAPSSLALTQQSLIESQYSGIARDIMRDMYDSTMELF